MVTMVSIIPTLEQVFRREMDECVFVEELSSKLEAANLDHWINLESKLKSLAARQPNTPEKTIDELFAAKNADEFMNLLLT